MRAGHGGKRWRKRSGRALARAAVVRAAVVRAAVVLVPIAAGSILVAACGSLHASDTGAESGASAKASPSAAPSSTATAAQIPLCQDAATVTGLEILRTGVLRIPQELQSAVPGKVVITKPAEARAVAHALCALPSMPPGMFNCPVLFPGTTYHLFFTAGDRQFPVVSVEATGCETVTGIGPVRQATTSAGFWRVLATAAGMSPPGRPVFSGSNAAGAAGCRPPSTRLYQTAHACPVVGEPSGAAQPG
jgi:hypothetical protein